TAVEQFQDTFGTRYYHILREKHGMNHDEAFSIAANFICRDGCRSPMQWRSAPNAGFSPAGVMPWLPINPDYTQGINVEDQRHDPDSMLHFFRRIVQVRQQNAALRHGSLRLIRNRGNVLAFWRETHDQKCLVAFNMSPHKRQFDLGEAGTRLVFSTVPAAREDPAGRLMLRPYEILVVETIS
ncbi:MAG: alpha-glucosidase C-terminal domain-containing protein, partial [Chloroflexi bacterium]|nr:alpha-glucosidase C-terminal domain-containing protein [Chloroflexota bacterium]